MTVITKGTKYQIDSLLASCTQSEPLHAGSAIIEDLVVTEASASSVAATKTAARFSTYLGMLRMFIMMHSLAFNPPILIVA